MGLSFLKDNSTVILALSDLISLNLMEPLSNVMPSEIPMANFLSRKAPKAMAPIRASTHLNLNNLSFYDTKSRTQICTKDN